MANNRVQDGDVLMLPVPVAGVTTGVGVMIGSFFVVALRTVAFVAGALFDGATEGVWDIVKVSTQAWVAGERIFFDAAAGKVTNVAAGNRYIGLAAADAANPTSTGRVRLNGVAAPMAHAGVPASYSTAGAVTYTAADVLAGTIVRDPNGASRSDVLPTAALLVAAVPGVKVGDTLDVLVINGADAAEVITIGAGAGGGFDANQTASSRVIGQNTSKVVRIRFTNVTAASEAYVVYA